MGLNTRALEGLPRRHRRCMMRRPKAEDWNRARGLKTAMGIAFESNPNHATWRRGRNHQISAGVVDDMSCLGCPAQVGR